VLPARKKMSITNPISSSYLPMIGGYGDLSLHGSTWIKTPNLDRMASEGTDFLNFTVNSPVCSPSRAAVMTGQFPARNSIHRHFASVDLNTAWGMPDWLDPSAPMHPDYCKMQGTRRATSASGTWEGVLEP
jgi:arylsulfatase A-like enzyme